MWFISLCIQWCLSINWCLSGGKWVLYSTALWPWPSRSDTCPHCPCPIWLPVTPSYFHHPLPSGPPVIPPSSCPTTPSNCHLAILAPTALPHLALSYCPFCTTTSTLIWPSCPTLHPTKYHQRSLPPKKEIWVFPSFQVFQCSFQSHPHMGSISPQVLPSTWKKRGQIPKIVVKLSPIKTKHLDPHTLAF